MIRIPIDSDGYSVNIASGTIHTRYAGDHAGDAYRTRRVKGVETLLDGRKPKVCAVCYPSPRYATPAPSSKPQLRRKPKTQTRKAIGGEGETGTGSGQPPSD